MVSAIVWLPNRYSTALVVWPARLNSGNASIVAYTMRSFGALIAAAATTSFQLPPRSAIFRSVVGSNGGAAFSKAALNASNSTPVQTSTRFMVCGTTWALADLTLLVMASLRIRFGSDWFGE